MNDAIVVEQAEVTQIQPELSEVTEVEPKLRPVSRGGYVDVMTSSLEAYLTSRLDEMDHPDFTGNKYPGLRNYVYHMLKEDEQESLKSVSAALLFSATTKQVANLISRMQNGDEKLKMQFDYLICSLYESYERSTTVIDSSIRTNQDFEMLVFSKIQHMVPFNMDNINLLASSESPLLMMNIPETIALTGWQAKFIVALSSLYAWHVYTDIQSLYVNGDYQKLDETVRDVIENICVHCLTILAKGSIIGSVTEWHRWNIMTVGMHPSSITSDTPERILAIMLWITQYDNDILRSILDRVYEQGESYYEVQRSSDIDMLETLGMVSITKNKKSWQPMLTQMFGHQMAYPVNTQPVDVGSMLMLEEYKKSGVFSLCLLGMQASMFVYLLNNDNDLFVHSTLKAVSEYVARVIPQQIPYEIEQTPTTASAVILSKEASSFVKALYGFYLKDFKAANPHVTLAE